MAIVGTNLTSGTDTSGGTTSTTASITPTANNLVLLAVTSRTNITANPNAPTVTGAGITWTQIATILYDSTSASRKLLTVYQALGPSPVSAPIVMSFALQAQTDVNWSVDQFSGINTTTPIVQSATNKDESNTSNTLTVTLAAFGSPSNAAYGAIVADNINGLTSIGGTFTQLSNPVSANLDMVAEYKATSSTTVTATFATTAMLGGVAIEIAQAGGGTVNSSTTALMMGVG